MEVLTHKQEETVPKLKEITVVISSGWLGGFWRNNAPTEITSSHCSSLNKSILLNEGPLVNKALAAKDFQPKSGEA